MIEVLPWVAFIAALLAVATAWLERAHDGPFRPWTRGLVGLAAAAALVTFLVLLWLFIQADVRFDYVFLYTHAELPLRYRIAGAWAGREGSLALWALWAALITAWGAFRWPRDATHRWSLVFLAGLSAALLGAVAMQDLFAPTSDFFLRQRPLGNGLNPTLQNDFFLIHPPLMFLAYALTHVPFATALGHMVVGTGRWSRIAEGAARFDWMLYTVAMGLGGIWAYYTLGFGGFWAWDPVEVANLLPWLALTVYLHAQRHHILHGRYATIGPALAMLPFLFTIFSTLSTRSGLWVSVHAFTDPTQTFNPDAAGRFLDILGVEPSLAFPVGWLGASMCLGLALWARRNALEHRTLGRSMRLVAGALGAAAVVFAVAPVAAYSALAAGGALVGFGRVGIGMLVILMVAVLVPAAPSLMRSDESRLRWDLTTLNYAAILILGAGLLVLWLWHMAAVNGWNTAFYETRLPFLAAPAVLAMTVFMGLPWGRVWALRAAGGVLVAGIVAGLVWSAGIGLFVAAGLLGVAAIDRTRRAVTLPGRSRLRWSRWTLMAGALLNVAFWLNPPTTLLGGLTPLAGRWPIQLVGGGLALWGWHRSLQHAAGRPGAHTTRWLVGLLGGFYIAPGLALVSGLLAKGVPTVATFKPARMQQAGLYTIHLAVAIALVGYSGATYLADHERGLLGPDGLAGVEMTHNGTDVVRSNGLVTDYWVTLETPDGVLDVPMRWEPTAGAYYPLPATLRTWDSDLYVSIDRLCLEPCADERDQIVPFQPTQPRVQGEVAEVTLSVHVLPAVGLVWTALAVFAHGMWILMWPGSAQSGIPLSRTSST